MYILKATPLLLKYIPLGQSLDVYSHLFNLICFFSQNLSHESVFSIFRLISRLSRAGYPMRTFSESPSYLVVEDLEFLSKNTIARVTLSNYLVGRFTFLLCRSLYMGLITDAHVCCTDLLHVALKQNLFIGCTSLLALVELIEILLKRDMISQREYLMIDPQVVNGPGT